MEKVKHLVKIKRDFDDTALQEREDSILEEFNLPDKVISINSITDSLKTLEQKLKECYPECEEVHFELYIGNYELLRKETKEEKFKREERKRKLDQKKKEQELKILKKLKEKYESS